MYSFVPSEGRTANKWDLIPPKWKDNVDSSLLQVLGLNRDFIGSVQQQVNQISLQNPGDFLNDLVSGWYNHNMFFTSLESFLRSLPKNGNLNRFQLNEAQKILDDSRLVDTVTLFHSLAIKPILERNGDAAFSPFSSFYIDYPLDHFDLVNGDVGIEEILEKYHGGSPQLFNQRKNKGILARIFSGNFPEEEGSDLRQIREKMFDRALYTGFLDRSENTRSLSQISTIDNSDEYRFLYNLKGIEGFFLKDYLVKNNLLQGSENGIESLLNYFTNLTITMDEEISSQDDSSQIPFYVQSNSESCAPACAMMVSYLLYNQPMSREKEMQMHGSMKSDFLAGCPFSKVAKVMSDLHPDIGMDLVHTNPRYFDDIDVEEILQGMGLKALKEYRYHAKEARERGVKVKITRDPIDFAESVVDLGGLYMAATELAGGVLHSELVLSRTGDNLRVYNPLDGQVHNLSRTDFKRRTHTLLGEWGLAFYLNSPTSSGEYQASVKWFEEKERSLGERGITINDKECQNGRKKP